MDAERITSLLEEELTEMRDERVLKHVRSLLVPPIAVRRDWNYGAPDEAYDCWSVLEHPASNTGIAYCEHGFGPRSPWGLVFLSGDEMQMSIGMDCSWYTTFFQTYFESKATTDLPIWRVLLSGRAISDELEWDAAWDAVQARRAQDPDGDYRVWTTVPYTRE